MDRTVNQPDRDDGQTANSAHEDLARRLAALPHPVLRDDAADRIRTRVLNELSVSAPPSVPFLKRFPLPNLLRPAGVRPALVGGGILATFPLSIQVALAASLMSVAVWMVARDVQAFPALPWQSQSSMQTALHCGMESEHSAIAPETLPLSSQRLKATKKCPPSSNNPKMP